MKVITQVENPELIKKRHLQIIKAARKLLSEKGYHQTTMRDVARESGINLSYLYKYISKKNDILYLYCRHLHEEWRIKFNELEIEKIDDPIEKLKTFMKARLAYIHGIVEEVLTIYTEGRYLEHEALKSVLSAEANTTLDIQKIIDDGVKKGVFVVEDPFVSANLVQFILGIEPNRRWIYRKKYTFEQMTDFTIRFVLRALNAKD